MKKSLILLLMVLMLALPAVETASAQKNKLNVKGEVISFDGGQLSVKSNKGEDFEFTLPLGSPDPQVGDSVLIRAVAAEGGGWVAVTVKILGQGADDDEGETGGFQTNSAYCAEGKKDSPHPLVAKISERFGVSDQMVMDYYCQGFSIGKIMLAIKTSQIMGDSASIDEILGDIESGGSWGLIWKDLGLIGWGKNGSSPPGQLKKLEPNNTNGDD